MLYHDQIIIYITLGLWVIAMSTTAQMYLIEVSQSAVLTEYANSLFVLLLYYFCFHFNSAFLHRTHIKHRVGGGGGVLYTTSCFVFPAILNNNNNSAVL